MINIGEDMTLQNIVLFDMDGTLTPARMAANSAMAQALHKLLNVAEIGIVTGSQYDYLVQQCHTIFNSMTEQQLNTVRLFPCNGAQYYSWNKNEWCKIVDKNMKNEMGEENFDKLIRSCLWTINAAVEDQQFWNMSGHFIEYRGPMVNISFPGRQADQAIRKHFVEQDKKFNIRLTALQRLNDCLREDNINSVMCKLGGDTSIDIFPSGWDKRLALNYLNNFNVWFVGDRCEGAGNDKEIYDEITKTNKAFKTTGPDHTIQIIDHIITSINQ